MLPLELASSLPLLLGSSESHSLTSGRRWLINNFAAGEAGHFGSIHQAITRTGLASPPLLASGAATKVKRRGLISTARHRACDQSAAEAGAFEYAYRHQRSILCEREADCKLVRGAQGFTPVAPLRLQSC